MKDEGERKQKEANYMARTRTREERWAAIERQVEELPHRQISPEERLKEAQRLASIYRKAGRPLPNQLAILV